MIHRYMGIILYVLDKYFIPTIKKAFYQPWLFFYYLKVLQLFLSTHCSFLFLPQTGIEDEKLCVSQPPFQLFDPDLQLPYQASAFGREQVTWPRPTGPCHCVLDLLSQGFLMHQIKNKHKNKKTPTKVKTQISLGTKTISQFGWWHKPLESVQPHLPSHH